MYCVLNKFKRATKVFNVSLVLMTSLLVLACTGGKSGVSIGNDSGTGAGAFSNFKVLTFQGNDANSWKTATASVWKTNLSTITITGTCSRGIDGVKVNQRLSGSSDAFADSGVTASCVNGAFTWTKSYTADTNYIATSLGSGFQYDFKIYAQDGVGAQITDPLALTAVKMFRLAPTVLSNVKYVKSLVQQTLVVLGTNTTITDSADGDTGGTGHCPASSAPFVLGGSVDPEANVGVSGASSLNSNSGTTLALTACVPFGSTSLVLYTKDESGSTLGSQYSVNVISNETITTFGFASQGFKMQNLSPHLNTLLSQGINLINVSSEHIGTATVNSSGTTGYTISVGLTNYTQQVSP